jgi:hypothetical protein
MNTRAVVCLNKHALVFLLVLILFTWVVFGAWGHGYLQCVCAQSRTKPCPPTCNNTATNYTTKRPLTYSANTQSFFFKEKRPVNKPSTRPSAYIQTYLRTSPVRHVPCIHILCFRISCNIPPRCRTMTSFRSRHCTSQQRRVRPGTVQM